MWFKKTAVKTMMRQARTAAEAVLESPKLKESKAKLEEVKGKLQTSFAELEATVAETTEKAVALNTRLTKSENKKAGVAFISRTGKLLFANRAAFSILRMRNTKNRRVIRLFKQDGSSQTVPGLAAAVYDKVSDGCFDIDMTGDNFLFKEPVVIEFDGEQLSRPVILRVSLADAHPQAVTDVIFICHMHSADTDELEESFQVTTGSAELGDD